MRGIIGAKEICVFTAIGICNAGFLSTHVGMMDGIKERDLTNVAIATQFVGGLYDPIEGHLDPSGTTHAYARCAKMNGAEVREQCKVEDIRQRADKMWVLTTNQGEILAEHVVNAGGL